MKFRERAVASQADSDSGGRAKKRNAKGRHWCSGSSEDDYESGAEGERDGERCCQQEAAAVGAVAFAGRVAEVGFVVPEGKRRLAGLLGLLPGPADQLAKGPVGAGAGGLGNPVADQLIQGAEEHQVAESVARRATQEGAGLEVVVSGLFREAHSYESATDGEQLTNQPV